MEAADQPCQHLTVGWVVVVSRHSSMPVSVAMAYQELVGSSGPVSSDSSRIGCGAGVE